MEKLNTSALMGKGPLDSVATKDKGRATITAIKYSALDKAMLFNFYSHFQPLWVWADRTSISPRKLSLHMDVRERIKASIKTRGKRSKKGGWEKRPRTRASQSVPRRKTSWASTVHSYAITMNTTTNHCPVTKA